ncbi:MAG: hypothetical protein ACI835_004711, partial [Planctomycetota bacterium]
MRGEARRPAEVLSARCVTGQLVRARLNSGRWEQLSGGGDARLAQRPRPKYRCSDGCKSLFRPDLAGGRVFGQGGMGALARGVYREMLDLAWDEGD